jgi:hypothetical protein
MHISALIGLFTRKPTPGDQAVLPDERRFQIGDREVVVRPLTFAEIKRVSTEIGVVLQRVATEFPTLDLTHWEQSLPLLVPALTGTIEELLGKLLGIEPAYLMEHLTPLRAIQIVRAIIEVNQVPLVISEIVGLVQMLRVTDPAATG